MSEPTTFQFDLQVGRANPPVLSDSSITTTGYSKLFGRDSCHLQVVSRIESIVEYWGRRSSSLFARYSSGLALAVSFDAMLMSSFRSR